VRYVLASASYADERRFGTERRPEAPPPGEPWLHATFHGFEEGAAETLCRVSLTGLHLFPEIDFLTRNPQVCCGECLSLVDSS
jgi:hypothetical protein